MLNAKEYLNRMNASPEEREEVLAWGRAGHDFMTNGDGIADDSGALMDYLSASRAMAEICEVYASMTPEELEEALNWRNPDPEDLVYE